MKSDKKGCNMMATFGYKWRNIRDISSHSLYPQLIDLPEVLLIRVASYLPRTSCVSFAMALSKQSPQELSYDMSSQPSATSIAIANASGESWEIIDFGDIQRMYFDYIPSIGYTIDTTRVLDGHIRWILLCIGAHNIKSLKLTCCSGITGSGLRPLIKSPVLERIDLSLVGDHESPNITPEPPISAVEVIPILNSILNTEWNSLVHVQLPKKWRDEESDILNHFLKKFDRQMNHRRFHCSKGCGICEGSDDYPLVQLDGESSHYGVNSITCYQCTNQYCSRCYLRGRIDFCPCCDKFYCNDCNKMQWCGRCYERKCCCSGCDIMKVW